ncbi:MAG: Decaprenyl-phosphate N-acetylglucosaminephosphotransferase, partial [uncultured Nocardioidaceae bacterium]
ARVPDRLPRRGHRHLPAGGAGPRDRDPLRSCGPGPRPGRPRRAGPLLRRHRDVRRSGGRLPRGPQPAVPVQGAGPGARRRGDGAGGRRHGVCPGRPRRPVRARRADEVRRAGPRRGVPRLQRRAVLLHLAPRRRGAEPRHLAGRACHGVPRRGDDQRRQLHRRSRRARRGSHRAGCGRLLPVLLPVGRGQRGVAGDHRRAALRGAGGGVRRLRLPQLPPGSDVHGGQRLDADRDGAGRLGAHADRRLPGRRPGRVRHRGGDQPAPGAAADPAADLDPDRAVRRPAAGGRPPDHEGPVPVRPRQAAPAPPAAGVRALPPARGRGDVAVGRADRHRGSGGEPLPEPGRHGRARGVVRDDGAADVRRTPGRPAGLGADRADRGRRSPARDL